jgi:integrase
MILAMSPKFIDMGTKNQKTTTYSLDWDVVVNLESRLLRDFQAQRTVTKGRELLMISIGSRLGLRVIDNLNLKYNDLVNLSIGEKFIRLEKKTNKERILVMSSKLKEVLNTVISVLNPELDHYIFSSQKGRGISPMSIQTFNFLLKGIINQWIYFWWCRSWYYHRLCTIFIC